MQFGVISTVDIGIGSVIPSIQASEHDVTAIASCDGAAAETVAGQFGIDEACEGYSTILETAAIDAVYIPLPNGPHAEWTRAAASEGIHVLREKPLTGGAPETRSVFDYCEE